MAMRRRLVAGGTAMILSMAAAGCRPGDEPADAGGEPAESEPGEDGGDDAGAGGSASDGSVSDGSASDGSASDGSGVPGDAAGDYPVYPELADLLQAADLVIEGRVVSQRVESVDLRMDPADDPDHDPEDPEENPQAGIDPGDADLEPDLFTVTLHEVSVDETYLGDLPASGLIEVRTMGDAGSPGTMTFPGPAMEVGGEYLFVLVEGGDVYYVLNPEQSVYLRTGDRFEPLLADGIGYPIEVTDLEAAG